MIQELHDRERLERLLRDSYANYVVQTALDFAEPKQRMMVIKMTSWWNASSQSCQASEIPRTASESRARYLGSIVIM
jgi:hypothetical protein